MSFGIGRNGDPMPPSLQDRPDVSVFNEIGIIEHLIRHAVVGHLPPGMTYGQFELLVCFIRQGDGQTPAELADMMTMSKAAVTTALQKMQDLGFVIVLADVKARRTKRVRLTKAGTAAYLQVLQDMQWKMDALREGFTDNEFSQALPFLKSLRTFLEEVSGPAEPEAAFRR